MSWKKSGWVLGLVLVLAAIVLPLVIFLPGNAGPRDNPRAHLPKVPPHTDHSALMKGPYADGPAVTRACLECHPDAAQEVMKTSHWTWESDPVAVPGHSGLHRIGKKNLINNFCISVISNWPGCTSCHAGYGWVDSTFDFTKGENVDCLVCHDHSGAYAKTKGGFPAKGADLVAAAKSVGRPTRQDCGGCHFKGGGGDAVKHGDLDETLAFPRERLDVHMGKYGMMCVDCHRTEHHQITGRAISVSVDDKNQVACTDCHAQKPHDDERLNTHVSTVACQTCHVPKVAIREATKVSWDWSKAGENIEQNPHHYLKKKGLFVYEQGLRPEYAWYNGTADRYLLGDKIDPDKITVLNQPRGDIHDPKARIWPFKVHRGKQIYDAKNLYFLPPKTVGKGGYWTDFDWDEAARLGAEAAHMKYSGSYGFARTEMYWPLTHMVAPKEEALRCEDCHGENGVLDWKALGYPGDPIRWGGRMASGLAANTTETAR